MSAEDWCRTWAGCRTIMLTRTSKGVKEEVQKMLLSAVVRLRERGDHTDRLKLIFDHLSALTHLDLRSNFMESGVL
jgi:hypothetical protein